MARSGLGEPITEPANNRSPPAIVTVVESNASLSLQILLYCNVRWAFVYLAVLLYNFYQQFYTLETIHRTLSVMAIVVSIPLEGCRLFCGYSGNLRNLVPDLVVFWILSTFIQLPIQLYFAINFDYFSTVFLIAILVQVVFISAELLIVTPSINIKSRQQIEQFKMAELIARNAN